MAKTRGVQIWVAFALALTLFASCDYLFTGPGNVFERILIAAVVMPIVFWLMAAVGAAVINVFVIGFRTFDAQITHSKEIQGDD